MIRSARGRFPRTQIRRCQPLLFLWLAVVAYVQCPGAGAADPRVVIISPHNEAIRYEFGRAFEQWHRQQFGEDASLEWRDVGGTTDALRFVQSEFAANP